MVAYFSPLNASFFFYKLSQQAMSLYDDTIFEILFVIINTCPQLTYNMPDTTYLCRHEILIMLPCAIIILTTRGNMLTYKLYIIQLHNNFDMQLIYLPSCEYGR